MPSVLSDDTQVDVEKLKRDSVRGGATTLASQAASIAIQLVSTVVLARLLAPEDYGVIAMVLAVTAFAGMFRDLGLSAASIQKKGLTRGAAVESVLAQRGDGCAADGRRRCRGTAGRLVLWASRTAAGHQSSRAEFCDQQLGLAIGRTLGSPNAFRTQGHRPTQRCGRDTSRRGADCLSGLDLLVASSGAR